MPSYEDVYKMINDDLAEAILTISPINSDDSEPYTVETYGDVYIKNMGACLMLIYVAKDTNQINKRIINPNVYEVHVTQINPIP